MKGIHMKYKHLMVNNELSIENVEDEYIVFLEKHEKVIILNKTSSRIFDYFKECSYDIELLSFMRNYFEFDTENPDELEEICQDMKMCINEMVDNNILISRQ